MERRLEIAPGFPALLCVLGWYDPALCLWFVLCLLVHEVGHGAAMRVLHVPVYGVSLKASGAVIQGGFCGYRQELLCALAGPAASFLMAALLCRRIPEAAVLSCCLGAVNLLPVYPLDGGRVLRAALLLKWDVGRAERLLSRVTVAVCCGLMGLACWVTVELQAGIWPIFASLAILWRAGSAKWSEQ